jgi:NAD-dependent deacetylase
VITEEQVIAALAEARRVVILTGAGVSAESGIPTFRDALSGLWARFDPAQLATEDAFRSNPALVWSWYAERRTQVAAAQPNAAHRAIAAFAKRTSTTLITQNVDGLHARAGSEDVIELHGNIGRASCLDGCGWSGPARALELADARIPPHCPVCGAHARPAVVWFGEHLCEDAYDAADAACASASVCLVIGTSAQVYPAAGLAENAARAGARLVIVNPVATPLDAMAWAIVSGTAATRVPRLLGEPA